MSYSTPPPEEPVSLAEAKTFLRIDGEAEDAMLSDLIASAREQVERRADTLTVARTVAFSLLVCGTRVALPVRPVRALVSVRRDGVMVEGTLPEISSETATLHLPTRMDATLEIEVEAGFGPPASVPAPLRQAILLLVADAYEHRERETGFARTSLRIDALLGPYRGPRL